MENTKEVKGVEVVLKKLPRWRPYLDNPKSSLCLHFSFSDTSSSNGAPPIDQLPQPTVLTSLLQDQL